LLLAACAAKLPAPVVDRSARSAGDGAAPVGYYRVNSGDTLYAIAFTQGVDYRQLARWNGLRAPYIIYPGQDLRLTAPPETATAKRQPAPAKSPPAAQQTSPKRPGEAPPASSKPVVQTAPPVVQAPAQEPQSDPDGWQWPAGGRVLRGFVPNEPSRKGLDIAGREGEPVKAAAAGTVVYSGNGLIGYGELIIIKHSERLLSAYGHNRRRLVAEGDRIRAGQAIAELGRNDRNEAMLHFEIRVQGQPVNPLEYLPPR
jgi:lipoprotein NlpD